MQASKSRILADLPADLLPRKRSWLLAGVLGSSLLGVVAATAMVPDAPAPIPTSTVVERLSPLAVTVSADLDQPFVHEDMVEPGDTVHTLFRRLGIRDAEALDFMLNSPEGKAALRQLRAGRSVSAMVRSDGTVVSLSLPVAQSGERLAIERGDAGIQVRTEPAAALATIVEMRSGTIRHSLFGATDDAGLPDSIATKLADLFGTEIDFHTDLRKGDQFSVVYETIYDQGAPARTGRVLAAEFINQGKRHVVVLHRGASGKDQYYTEDGRSLQQAFLRSPLEFSRVTSNFGRRLHPIHKSWRAHNGVDFGAPTGTPVKATSDGVVEFVGSQNGYGNIVVLRHRGKYSTAYAHLNGFARSLRKGAAVDQGDVIGYVGSTGWATGPHLHYEVRIDNTPHDPMSIALPTAEPLSPQELVAFRATTQPWLHQLALLKGPRLASAAQ